MFNIQYRTVDGSHKMQAFDSRSRQMLVRHLTQFDMPICAVYEQATVITKAVRAEMAQIPANRLSRAARDFIAEGVMTPA